MRIMQAISSGNKHDLPGPAAPVAKRRRLPEPATPEPPCSALLASSDTTLGLIARYWTPAEVWVLGTTCRRLRRLVFQNVARFPNAYLTLATSFRLRLAALMWRQWQLPLSSLPLALLDDHKRPQCVLTGSLVLQALTGDDRWKANDIDLFCTRDAASVARQALGKHLVLTNVSFASSYDNDCASLARIQHVEYWALRPVDTEPYYPHYPQDGKGGYVHRRHWVTGNRPGYNHEAACKNQEFMQRFRSEQMNELDILISDVEKKSIPRMQGLRPILQLIVLQPGIQDARHCTRRFDQSCVQNTYVATGHGLQMYYPWRTCVLRESRLGAAHLARLLALCPTGDPRAVTYHPTLDASERNIARRSWFLDHEHGHMDKSTMLQHDVEVTGPGLQSSDIIGRRFSASILVRARKYRERGFTITNIPDSILA